jgi:hypothetical protein
MSNIRRFSVIAAVVILTAALAAAQAPSAQTDAGQQTLFGTVKCAAQASGHFRCGRNQTLLTCTLACVAQGSGFVLQTHDGTYGLTGDESLLEQLAGGKATLTGQVTGSTLAVIRGSDHVADDSSTAVADK